MSSSGIENCDLSLTGSPLEDDASIHEIMSKSISHKCFGAKPWSDIEESYSPLPINKAREILNCVTNEKFPKGSKGWIFILASDESLPLHKAIIFLSSHISSDGNFARGLATYHGVVAHQEKSMKHLLNRHKAIARGIDVKFEIQIENVFELTPSIMLKFKNLGEETSKLSSIDKFTEVMLFQQVEINNGNQICKELWEQINLLFAIQSDIVRFRNNSGDGTLCEPTYSYGSMSYEQLQERVNHILSDVVTINENDLENVDTALEAVVKRVYQRPLTEVTDQLWELLKFASSYSDLKKIITFVFQISSRSCIVNIPMNVNRMGELIRELTHQRLAIPHLTSTEPLELLLEIGLEKIMKDYEFIFCESKICLLRDIKIGEGKGAKASDNRFSVRKSLAGSSAQSNQSEINRKTLLHGPSAAHSPDTLDIDEIRNSRFSERDSQTFISKLAQIHLAVEHLLLIQSHLNLENDYATYAKKILENPLVSFEELQKRKIDKFEVPINDKNVTQLVNKLIPNAQKITMRSENNFKIIENIFYYNIEQIVPFLDRKENEGDDAVERKGNAFHFLSHTNIVSKF